jgi:hypothetical protein
MKFFVYLIWGITLIVFNIGCSGDYKMVQHQRDQTFFNSLLNNGAELGSIEAESAKIEKVKLLQTNEDYPIRIVLYNNGRFYYQVDELGQGIGDWKYEDGGLRLTSRRRVFDLNFYLTAAAETGDEILVKFFDRHGFNQYSLNFRNPQKLDSQNPPDKLREFKSSIKDI